MESTYFKLLLSVMLIMGAAFARWLLLRYIRRFESKDQDLPKRWLNTGRNALSLLVVVGLITIWLSELRFLALSIATFTVALIIATREFIQCFLGTLYITSTRSFVVGDWVEVGNHTGEVASHDWLTTKLQEIDNKSVSYCHTGKTIVLPNNQFLLNPVYNLNYMRRYVTHSFDIVRDVECINVFDARDYILERAKHYCEPFQEVAERYSNLIDKRLNIPMSGSDASVRITTTNLGKNQFTISIFCPTQEAVNIEQKLIQDFMSYWHEALNRVKRELAEQPTPRNTRGQDDGEAEKAQ